MQQINTINQLRKYLDGKAWHAQSQQLCNWPKYGDDTGLCAATPTKAMARYVADYVPFGPAMRHWMKAD